MSTPNQPVSIALFFSQGSSDKEYCAEVAAKGDGWVCNFAYGRRGSALKAGTKTQEPVSWEKAFKLYTALVKSKTSKGYTPSEGGTPYVGTDFEERQTGLVPMLPTAIKDDQLHVFMNNPDYFVQQKLDGENRMLAVGEEGVEGTNRRGLATSVRADWTVEAMFITQGRHVFCGEDLGEKFGVFDIAEIGGRDIRHMSAEDRFHMLRGLLEAGQPTWMELAETAFDANEKRALFHKIEQNNDEGVVFKHRRGLYEEGRSTNAMKYKIQESATFKVIGINAQRSVALGLYDANGNMEQLGNVTIPANQAVPEKGDLVEVQFLYRFENGSLEQPKYKGVRTDLGDIKPNTDQIQRIKRKKAA